MKGKYPKHPETSRKALKKFFDLLWVPKFGLELFPSLTVFVVVEGFPKMKGSKDTAGNQLAN